MTQYAQILIVFLNYSGKSNGDGFAHAIELPRHKLSKIRSYIFASNERATHQNNNETNVHIQSQLAKIGQFENNKKIVFKIQFRLSFADNCVGLNLCGDCDSISNIRRKFANATEIGPFYYSLAIFIIVLSNGIHPNYFSFGKVMEKNMDEFDGENQLISISVINFSKHFN